MPRTYIEYFLLEHIRETFRKFVTTINNLAPTVFTTYFLAIIHNMVCDYCFSRFYLKCSQGSIFLLKFDFFPPPPLTFFAEFSSSQQISRVCSRRIFSIFFLTSFNFLFLSFFFLSFFLLFPSFSLHFFLLLPFYPSLSY